MRVIRSALSQSRSARRAGHRRATPPNAASAGKEPASKGIDGLDRCARCPNELWQRRRRPRSKRSTDHQEAAVEREAHSIGAPAIGRTTAWLQAAGTVSCATAATDKPSWRETSLPTARP